MKSIILFTLFITLSISTVAQNFQWAKGINGTSWINGHDDRAIALDASGNVYTTGRFSGTVDFDPGVGTFNLTATSDDIFISKLDATGNFVWAKNIGSSTCYSCGGTAIAVSASGIYVTGTFEGTIDFDPGSGVFNLSTTGSGYHFNLKLDALGNFNWATSMWGWSYSIAVDTDQNVYTTGIYPLIFGLSSINDIFITKQNALGGNVWQKQIGDPYSDEKGLSITVDLASNVFIAGTTNGGSVDLDPGLDVYAFESSEFILKLNSSGNFVWVKNAGGSIYSIMTDATGNVYTTGSFSGNVDFDPGVGTNNLTGNNDIFISKLDASGNFLWAKAATGGGYDVGTSLIIDAQGYVYVTGYFSGTVYFDSESTSNLTSLTSAGSTDIFILRIDALGTLEWLKKLGGPEADRGNAIVVDASRNIYTVGTFRETVDFDPGTATYSLTAISPDNIFISKLCTAPSPSLISGSVLVAAESIQTYSVNSVGATGYLWSAPSGATIVEGQNTPSAKIKFGVTSGEIIMVPNNSCGSGVSSSIVITIDPTTAIDEQTLEKGLEIYPNPSEGILFLKISEDLISSPFIITDLMDKEVLLGRINTSTAQVDISHLDNGLYILHIGIIHLRIVKQ